ncbi:MAG TPA: redoxin domain-containing protein [Tepidisphaeraceae bacterium]|jgi:peroxiredoxin|nr:redoxin domain-containing protein [Tepidisphaeraceae bacterium]
MKIRANPLEVGDLVPMPLDVAPTVELTDRQKPLGRPVVLFFFVGTAAGKSSEAAVAFRDLYDEFINLGTTVFGVSVANLEKLKAFANEHRLPFPLLADVQLKLSLAYGAARPERVKEKKAEISIAPRTCSLLHEATDLTAGKRFVLLTFFYGEAERKLRDEYAKKQDLAGQKAS